MLATKNECNQGGQSIYRPEANAWISKRSSDLYYKGVFALIKIGFLQSSFYEVMWSSLHIGHSIILECCSKYRKVEEIIRTPYFCLVFFFFFFLRKKDFIVVGD